MNLCSPELKDYIKKSFQKGSVVCLSGAGISAESGIPTFRGKGGLWEKYDPQVYANTQGLILEFRRHPQNVVNFIVDFYSLLLRAQPNPAHMALAALEKAGIITATITQNVDNLHREAGSRNIIELHGNAFRIRCMSCQNNMGLEKERIKELIESLKINPGSYFGILRVLSRYFPRCNCGSRYRIDIVLFGETLPAEELSLAYKQVSKCKVLLLIGSSMVIYPAADLPVSAKEKGATLIEINNEPSALSRLCDYKIMGKASQALPEILNILKNRF